jgi:spore maturation protein CgeB
VSDLLKLGVLGWTPLEHDLHGQHVGYQHAQFLAMREHADMVFGRETLDRLDELDAVLAFDERQLVQEIAPSLPEKLGPLLVYVTHDHWHRPLHVTQFLERYDRVLTVVRHEQAARLHRFLLPDVPCVVQRPGVDATLFRPAEEPKRWDILLSGNDSADYPVRRRLNDVVRAQADRRGWNVLDLTRPAPGTPQYAYAPTLAAAKVSPTGTPLGKLAPSKIVMQFVSESTPRTEVDDPFYSYDRPEVVVKSFNLGGCSPRYLESFACKTLLVGDVPDGEEWYADKMVSVTLDESDEEIGDLIDHWVRADDERERLVEHAYAETMRTETTGLRAAELVEIVRDHL